MQIGNKEKSRLCEGWNPRGGQKKCSNQILQHRIILHTDSCQDLPGKKSSLTVTTLLSQHGHLIPPYSPLRPDKEMMRQLQTWPEHLAMSHMFQRHACILPKTTISPRSISAVTFSMLSQACELTKSSNLDTQNLQIHSNGLKRFRELHCQTHTAKL